MKFAKILSLILCALMLVSVFVGCQDTGDDNPKNTSDEAVSDGDDSGNTPEMNRANEALAELKDKRYDFTDREFGMLIQTRSQEEYKVESGETGKLLSDAVFLRNATFEDTFGVAMNIEVVDGAAFMQALQSDVQTDGIYDVAINHTNMSLGYARAGLLYNFLDLENLNLDETWWDQGTKSFVISDKLFFMNGSFNYDDDNCTYVILFNKKIYDDHKSELPSDKTFYESVKDREWTLDYFHEVTQDISSENGDGTWDDLDTYGFVTTWEYGTTFFYGSGLHYIVCPEDENPYIDFGETSMEKATNLLDKVLKIYYTKNATYWPAGGSEALGLKAFTESRALFYGEVVSYIMDCDAKMTDPFGVLPVPKYDKTQETYYSWTHGISASMMVGKQVDDPEKVGALIEGFNIISEQQLRPVYYETVLFRKSLKDEDSRDMLDYIFKGRVYDLAMYYGEWGLTDAFKQCVNNNSPELGSKIGAVKTAAERNLKSLIKAFEKLK